MIDCNERAAVFNVDGKEYTVIFSFVGDYTAAHILWHEGGKTAGLAGHAKRNPKDTYDANIGMRVAMRTACGIDNVWGRKMPNLFRAFRVWQRDNRQ